MIKLILLIFLLIIVLRLFFRKVIDLPNYKGLSIADNSNIQNLMSEDKFWNIIHTSRNISNRNYKLQCESITQSLESMTSEEIIQFDRTLTVLMANSFSYRLWEAAYALNGGCSDDAFEYFRSWLISQGKNKFYWTIKYPRILFLIGAKELIERYEGLSYCAHQALQEKNGRDIPQKNDIHYPDGGHPFREGEAFLRYPELALLAW